MILLYRLVNNDIGIDFSDLFTISSVTSTIEATCISYINPMLLTGQDVTFFFSIRAVNPWNSLPDYVVTAQSLNVSRTSLMISSQVKMTQTDF